MARLARVAVFAGDEIAIVHVMDRTVRHCLLLGVAPVTGKDFDHRNRWLDQQLIHQARHFGIDLLCQAILSNLSRRRSDGCTVRSTAKMVGIWHQ